MLPVRQRLTGITKHGTPATFPALRFRQRARADSRLAAHRSGLLALQGLFWAWHGKGVERDDSAAESIPDKFRVWLYPARLRRQVYWSPERSRQPCDKGPLMTRLINPAGLKSQDFYNHAVVKRGFPVFVTGQVAWDEAGNVVGVGDIAAQAARIWHNIGLVLRELGAGPSDVVKLVNYAIDRSSLPALHLARRAFFGSGPYPASTFIVVAGLAEPELLAEIDVTVMISE